VGEDAVAGKALAEVVAVEAEAGTALAAAGTVLAAEAVVDVEAAEDHVNI